MKTQISRQRTHALYFKLIHEDQDAAVNFRSSLSNKLMAHYSNLLLRAIELCRYYEKLAMAKWNGISPCPLAICIACERHVLTIGSNTGSDSSHSEKHLRNGSD